MGQRPANFLFFWFPGSAWGPTEIETSPRRFLRHSGTRLARPALRTFAPYALCPTLYALFRPDRLAKNKNPTPTKSAKPMTQFTGLSSRKTK